MTFRMAILMGCHLLKQQKKLIDSGQETTPHNVNKAIFDYERENFSDLIVTKENIGHCINQETGKPIESTGRVEIPDQLYDEENERLRTVTGLDGTFKGNADITEVIVPNHVTFCSKDTFENCPNLKEVNMDEFLAESMNEPELDLDEKTQDDNGRDIEDQDNADDYEDMTDL